MTNKKTTAKDGNNSTEIAPIQNNSELMNFDESLFNAFAEKPDHELNELTSTLLKLEAGEKFDGVMANEIEMLKNEEGEEYECCVLYGKDKSKVLIADAVAVSSIKRYFDNNGTKDFAPVRIVCKGMRKSSTDSKREYRDLKIMTI